MKKTKLMSNSKFDELYTPEYAIYPIIDKLDKHKIIWECCYGTGQLKKHLTKNGFNVVGDPNIDFFKNTVDCDIIVTNPPFSLKRKMIERAFELGKPFAFLVPLTILEGKKSMELFNNKNIEIIIPSKRIDFMDKGSSNWFCVIWLTYGLNIGKQISYYNLTEI